MTKRLSCENRRTVVSSPCPLLNQGVKRLRIGSDEALQADSPCACRTPPPHATQRNCGVRLVDVGVEDRCFRPAGGVTWLNVAHVALARQEPILFDVSLEDFWKGTGRGTRNSGRAWRHPVDYAGLEGQVTAPGHQHQIPPCGAGRLAAQGQRQICPVDSARSSKRLSALPLSTFSHGAEDPTTSLNPHETYERAYGSSGFGPPRASYMFSSVSSAKSRGMRGFPCTRCCKTWTQTCMHFLQPPPPPPPSINGAQVSTTHSESLESCVAPLLFHALNIHGPFCQQPADPGHLGRVGVSAGPGASGTIGEPWGTLAIFARGSAPQYKRRC